MNSATQSNALISERCLELQKHRKHPEHATPATLGEKRAAAKTSNMNSPCKFLNRSRIAELCDTSLRRIADIEEVVAAGRVSRCYPYYASRAAVRTGAPHVLCVPYNALLHRDIRASVGIRLHRNTVVSTALW